MRVEKTDSSLSANIYLAATHRLTIISTVPRREIMTFPNKIPDSKGVGEEAAFKIYCLQYPVLNWEAG